MPSALTGSHPRGLKPENPDPPLTYALKAGCGHTAIHPTIVEAGASPVQAALQSGTAVLNIKELINDTPLLVHLDPVLRARQGIKGGHAAHGTAQTLGAAVGILPQLLPEALTGEDLGTLGVPGAIGVVSVLIFHDCVRLSKVILVDL